MGGSSSTAAPDVDMSGKVVIVTGSSAGIGYETAKRLSYMGAKVILACRDEAKAQAAADKMKEECKQEPGKEKDLQLEIMALDLNSLKSVVDFVEAFKEKGYQLNVLICNAGLGLIPQGVSVDGHEKHFQVNYLSHFLLILLLLPVLRETGGDCRILNVSSSAHKAGTFDLDNIQAQKSYDRMKFYGNSKLFQIMMTYALQRRLQSSSIRVFAVHPGVIKSEFSRGGSDSTMVNVVLKVVYATGISKDLAYGAATSLICATSPTVIEKTACYYEPLGKPSEPSASARVEADQEALWKYSLDLLKDYVTEETLQGLETAAS